MQRNEFRSRETSKISKTCGVSVSIIIGAKALNIIFADGFAVIFFGRSFTSLLPLTLKEIQPGIPPNPID